MPSVPPLLMLLPLPLEPLVVSSLSLEVFQQGLNVCLWTVPELESNTSQQRQACCQRQQAAVPLTSTRGFAPPGGHRFKLQTLLWRDPYKQPVSQESWAMKPDYSLLQFQNAPCTVCESSAGPLHRPRHKRASET